MTPEIESVVAQIPIRHDLASYIMLLGVVQSFFLAGVIFLRAQRSSAIFFLGLTMLSQAIIFLDTFLCYTGLIGQVLFLNDSTEPLVLVIPVSFYLFALKLVRKSEVRLKLLWLVLVLPVFYALSQVPYYLAPTGVKLNAYLSAYYADLCCVSVPGDFAYSYQWIKNHFDWLILLSFLCYGIMGLRLVWQERHQISLRPNQTNAKRYKLIRNSVIILFVLLILVFAVFYKYDDDGGDHYIGISLAVISFLTTYIFLADSRFFETSWFADKYQTVSVNINFDTVDAHITKSNFYLERGATISRLAEQLESSSNAISKAINGQLGVNFNDYINAKRVAMAKSRLLDKEFAQLTIEAIGQSVGFGSKSTFYAAFKKHHGGSPASFVKENRS